MRSFREEKGDDDGVDVGGNDDDEEKKTLTHLEVESWVRLWAGPARKVKISTNLSYSTPASSC